MTNLQRQNGERSLTYLKTLYWGDNGVHEFWESEDRELLIFRNHHEQGWTAHRNHCFLFASSSAEKAAERLNVELSRAQTWAKQAGGRYALENVVVSSQVARNRKDDDK